jgi:hypothetical protein
MRNTTRESREGEGGEKERGGASPPPSLRPHGRPATAQAATRGAAHGGGWRRGALGSGGDEEGRRRTEVGGGVCVFIKLSVSVSDVLCNSKKKKPQATPMFIYMACTQACMVLLYMHSQLASSCFAASVN